jgi:hypothetical protein
VLDPRTIIERGEGYGGFEDEESTPSWVFDAGGLSGTYDLSVIDLLTLSLQSLETVPLFREWMGV